MERYRVILATRVRIQLLNHASVLARVSLPAAKRFRTAFWQTLGRLRDNPYQFPLDPLFNKLNMKYRNALFEGRYKILFTIEGSEVFVDSVIDCRQQLTPS